jgi:hypothetical protein
MLENNKYLKKSSCRKLLIGKHLNEAFDVIAKNSYACEFVYDNRPIKSLGRGKLVVKIDENNIVIAVK